MLINAHVHVVDLNSELFASKVSSNYSYVLYKTGGPQITYIRREDILLAMDIADSVYWFCQWC